MKRRSFIQHTAQASLGALLISDALQGCRTANKTEAPANGEQGRILVLVQLDGGNDGLNTVIPINQYASLQNARKALLIPENKILRLKDSDTTGFHPAMKGMQDLYNNQLLSVIQGVGNPYPNLSHFKAIEIWNTCCNIEPDNIKTGWLGRYLDEHHATGTLAGPAAIQTASGLSQALQGRSENKGMAVPDESSYFYDLRPGHYKTDSGPAGGQLAFVRRLVTESRAGMLQLRQAAQAQKNLSTMYPPPGNNDLADQMKIIAQMIGGGIPTRVYLARLKGFDTHISQVDSKDTTQGDHARLLGKLSEAIIAFQDDLLKMGKQHLVTGMVFSEFGRRIMANASFGCDHGTSGPVILFGAKLKGGITGRNPEIPIKADTHDNLDMQTDFRSVYASVLKDWMGASTLAVEATLMGKFTTLNLFKD